MTMDSQVYVKAETRNHKGFFVKQGAYKLKNIDESGWALICVDDTVCYYVDPDNLDTEDSEETVES
ncbi:conserved hypothetical protein [Planktothrix serta PCC 8927]|uniref:Uncharacterized protein n=1 Tax=Planktothrix serta PCC 8927 TaxID=671068 RepID=A0A7Z9BMT5_9CYAN|nr:hypothetical protein [Planktothrix serta]VXD15254.1 conserved hypothetical protein [Planktothrix serta PCC 8927]